MTIPETIAGEFASLPDDAARVQYLRQMGTFLSLAASAMPPAAQQVLAETVQPDAKLARFRLNCSDLMQHEAVAHSASHAKVAEYQLLLDTADGIRDPAARRAAIAALPEPPAFADLVTAFSGA